MAVLYQVEGVFGGSDSTMIGGRVFRRKNSSQGSSSTLQGWFESEPEARRGQAIERRSSREVRGQTCVVSSAAFFSIRMRHGHPVVVQIKPKPAEGKDSRENKQGEEEVEIKVKAGINTVQASWGCEEGIDRP